MNWARVEELHDEVGEDSFIEVLDMFLEETGEVVARLAAAPDPARLEDDMHFLKGAALNLGFDGFATLCQAAEIRARSGGAASIDVPMILASYEASKNALLEGLSEIGKVA